MSEDDFKPPTEETKQPGSSMAPKELPSLEDSSDTSASAQTTAAKTSVAHEKNIKRRVEQKASETDDDKSLYFAILRARLQDEKHEKEAIEELSSNAAQKVIDRLHSHYQRDMKEESVTEVNDLIKQKMQPLQLLESEWRMLQRESKMLAERLTEIEDDIKQQTTDLMDLIDQKVERTEKLKTHQSEHHTVGEPEQAEKAQPQEAPQVIQSHHV